MQPGGVSLRPWQSKPVYQLVDILKSGSNAVDMSDTGVGKTYVACAVAAYLDLPTLAIVPKIAVTNWRQIADSFGIRKFQAIGYERLRTGLTDWGRWEKPPLGTGRGTEYVVCESCQCQCKLQDLPKLTPCYCHSAGIHCIRIKKKPWDYGQFKWSPIPELLIFDEVHRCVGLDSLNSEMLIAAKRDGKKVLGLSATAGLTPLHFKALGYVLELHGLNLRAIKPNRAPVVDFKIAITSHFKLVNHQILPTWRDFAYRYGCRHDPNFHGLKWMVGDDRQEAIMREIRSDILPDKGVRITTESIPNFPKRQITAELYDIEKHQDIDKLYQTMAVPLGVLEVSSASDSDLAITQRLRARQRIELLKVPIFAELAEDYLAKWLSVAIFINFTQSIEELAKLLKTNCIVDGKIGAVQREYNIQQFQSNKSRVILVNIAAGGAALGLHDTDGNFPRMGLVSPGESAIQLQQVFGRLPRDGGKSTAYYRVICAARTVEERMWKAINSKLNNLAALNDADLRPEAHD